jgi:hypothetical protein
MLGKGSVVGGRYEIEGEIGRGGFAVVYAARDRQVGTEVALKAIVPPPASVEAVRARTRREILAVRALAHPNVVPIYDLIEEGPYLVLVMERVVGSDLDALVTARGPLPADEIALLGRGVADALAAAHRRGIIHRDVKPRNVLVDGAGQPRLTDFGAARMEGQETLSHTAGMIGTIDYAAPEALAGRRVDARADVHGLGMTLFFAAAGRLPPRSAPHLPPTPADDGHHPARLRGEVPGWLDAIIARATAADPRQRFPTAAGMAAALNARALAPLPLARAMAGRPELCVVCGAADPLGQVVCERCAAEAAGPDDTSVVVEASSDPAVRIRVAALLAVAVDSPDVTEVAAGRRVLVTLPAALAGRAAAQLATRGVPARVARWGGAWRLVPGSLYFVAAAALGVGTWAGAVGSSVLGLASPWVAGAVLLVGRHAVGRPALVRHRSPARVPVAVAGLVSATLRLLPGGEARTLLSDVIRLGCELCAAAPSLEQEAAEIVRAACAAAPALARVEETLAQIADRRPAESDATARPVQTGGEQAGALRARLESSRAALTQHLLGAIAALGDALARSAEPDADVLARLATASRELHEELAHRSEAAAELESLLNS